MGPPEPAYLATYDQGALQERAERARAASRSCRMCPRDCRVDRLYGAVGVCRVGRFAHVASAFAHFGEEDCLRGWRGSGTIFFGGCNLRCVFCQNADISQRAAGEAVAPSELAALMLELQTAGCHNINLVTPEHVVAQILEALPLAVEGGLRLPLVYNTSAYDSLESLQLLDGVVDIYMPDFKLWSEERSRRWLGAADYPTVARAALQEMHRQVGDLQVDVSGIARRGLLVRHLVMPGALDETASIARFLAERISPDTYVNIMGQYHPAGRVVSSGRFPELGRHVTPGEMLEAAETARRAGLRRFDRRSSRLL